MISAYQAFKMVLGLMISGFVIYFLIFYTGTYSQTQQQSQQLTVLKNFEKLAQDVHATGNPSPFTGFSEGSFRTLSFEIREPEGHAQVVADVGKLALKVPLLFRPGEEVFVDSASMDLGWWEFSAVAVMPGTTVIINPVDASRDSWEYMKDAVELMPSTIGFEPKVTFGLCDGGVIVKDFLGLCGPSEGVPCEREYFMRMSRPDEGLGACTATIPEGGTLVTLSGDCSGVQKGVCFEPPSDGTGYAYIAGSQSPYLYHDPMDWAAIIIGGDRSDIYGLAGESLWRHKNMIFSTQVGLAAEAAAERSRMLATAIEDEVDSGSLSAESQSAACKQDYLDLGSALDVVADTLSFQDYYKSPSSSRQLNQKLQEARQIERELVNKGCEKA